MIVRARVVVTMDGAPIENGAVAISGDRIIEVGTFPDINRRHSQEETVDLGQQALLPGLINAHCHLDYTCLAGRIPRQKSFTDWIRSINSAKAGLTSEDYVASINHGFAQVTRFGTTAIANLTGFPQLVSQTSSPIRTWWFAELIDVRDPTRANEIVDHAVEELKLQKCWGLAPHAPFTASTALYRRCGGIAEHENILLTTHLAESREEMSMFRDAKGSLYEFLKSIGRDMSDCGKATPVERFAELFSDSPTPLRMTENWILIHLNEISDEDLECFGKKEMQTSIVHCPRSHQYFGHSPFQFEKLRDLGFNLCLGTDSLASNDDLSLFAEMRAFQKEFSNASAEEILKMVTINPAFALKQKVALGKIREDFFADLIAVPLERSKSIFESIVAFDRPIAWSMVGGRTLP